MLNILHTFFYKNLHPKCKVHISKFCCNYSFGLVTFSLIFILVVWKLVFIEIISTDKCYLCFQSRDILLTLGE